MEELELTILMPCLNEENTMKACIGEAKKFLVTEGVTGEILIADNGSFDESVYFAELAGARVIHVKKRGYGCALQGGIQKARGRYIILGDCDMSYNFTELQPFLEKLREGFDLVVGNRMNGRMEAKAMPISHKYFGVPFLSFLGRKRFHTDIKDFHCGLRGINRAFAQKMNYQTTGMEFATEMIGLAAKAGGKMTNVDIAFRKDQRGKRSHLRTIRDGVRHLKYILHS